MTKQVREKILSYSLPGNPSPWTSFSSTTQLNSSQAPVPTLRHVAGRTYPNLTPGLPTHSPTLLLPSHANGSFTNRNWASASPRDLVRVKEISSSRFAMAQGQPNPNEVTTPARFFASLLRRDITSSPKEMTRESDLLRRSCSGRRSTAPGWSPSTARASSTASTIEWCALLAREMFDYKWLEC